MQEDQNRSLRKLFGQLTGASLLVTGPAFGLPQGFPQVVDGQTTLCHIVFDYFRGSNPEKEATVTAWATSSSLSSSSPERLYPAGFIGAVDPIHGTGSFHTPFEKIEIEFTRRSRKFDYCLAPRGNKWLRLEELTMLQVPGQKRSIVLPIFAAVLAAGIFAADTATNLDIAVPVLYVAVVLISVQFCERRGVLLVAAGCIALTLFSSVLTGTDIKQTGFINTAISILAVGLTTFLALKIESARFTAKTLIEADQLRDALIGSVSHELRTPLASILGGVSILAEMPNVAKDARLASLAAGIRDEAMRLNSDIQNLLDAALITSQGLHSRRDWTDPTDIIDAAVERIRLRYPGRLVELSLGSNLPLVHIDPVLVEQALSQIIANAAKFSNPPSTIQVSAFVKHGELLISVHDDGVGLTAEERSKLSERFFRGQRHVGKIPGSGLGLWVANTFITSSGGKLEATSPGECKGTTIQIVFPISQYVDESETAMQDA